MSSLSQLSNQELDRHLKTLVGRERKLTALIVEHIKEVDRRQLYLEFHYPSLFDYVTKELGYAAGPAQRRIDAARHPTLGGSAFALGN